MKALTIVFIIAVTIIAVVAHHQFTRWQDKNKGCYVKIQEDNHYIFTGGCTGEDVRMWMKRLQKD